MTTRIRRFPSLCCAGALASAAGAMAFAPILCVATPRASMQPDTVVTTVSVSDLDLSKQGGMRTARRRLEIAAVRLCRTFSDSRRISDVATMEDCVRDAVADALRRVNTASDTSAPSTRAMPTR